MILRRKTLKALILSAVAGKLMIGPAFGTADIETRPYVSSVCQARAIIALSRENQKSNSKETTAIICQKTNDLLGFMLDHFTSPASVEDTRLVFTRGSETITDSNIQQLADSVIPLGIMRDLCFRYQINIPLRTCPNWKLFVSRYKDALLEI